MFPFDGSAACWIVLGGLVAVGMTLAGIGARCALAPVAVFGGLVTGAALFWASSPAFADEAADLVRRAEARGRDAEAALLDWVAEVGRRGAAYQAEAQALASSNAARLKQGFSYLEGDDLFGSAHDLATADATTMNDDGVVYVAVSFSMKPEALRALSAEARRAGAVLVVRGFVDGSVPKTLAAAKTVFDESAASGLAIDPQVFRAFKVERAPTFIVARAAVQPCDGGVACTSAPTPHDKLSGNITLSEALRLLAAKGRDAPDVARSALARLEG